MFWKLFIENALLVFAIVGIGQLLSLWLIKPDPSAESDSGEK